MYYCVHYCFVLLYASFIFILQRNIYLPVKCTARIVDYLTAKYPLIELARIRKYIVNPKWHFVYALRHRSRDPWRFPASKLKIGTPLY